MLDPAPAAFFVGTGNEGGVRIPRRRSRAPTSPAAPALDDREPAVTLELLAIAAVDQAPVRPGLCNQRLQLHQATAASRAPTDAMAVRPSSNAGAGRFGRRSVDCAKVCRASRRAGRSVRTPRSIGPSGRRGPAVSQAPSGAPPPSAPWRGEPRRRSASRSCRRALHGRGSSIRPRGLRSAAQPIATRPVSANAWLQAPME